MAIAPQAATTPSILPGGLLAGEADVRLVPWEAALGPGSAGSPTLGASFRALRLAWVGRTSTYDQQDPSLSLPRQLASSREALPPGWVIVAHFYDVESGRLDLDARGHGTAHQAFDLAFRATAASPTCSPRPPGPAAASMR